MTNQAQCNSDHCQTWMESNDNITKENTKHLALIAELVEMLGRCEVLVEYEHVRYLAQELIAKARKVIPPTEKGAE